MLNINTQEEFDNLIDKIRSAYLYYINGYTSDNKYTLYLADGKRISYSISPDMVPHLLGVNVLTIKNCPGKKNLNAEAVLNLLLEDSYSLYRKVQNKEIKYSDIFSDYIEDKLEIFRDQLRNPFPNEIYFICEYDTKKTYLEKEVDRFKADYYIARKQDNGDIALLGFVKNDMGTYNVKTNRLIRNDDRKIDELKDLLKNQIITFETSLDIQNYQTEYSKKYHLRIEEKKETIQNIIDLCNKTDAIPNTAKNNLFDILCLSKTKNEGFNKKIILSSLIASMKINEIFEIDSLDDEVLSSMDEETKDLIKEYNNYICSIPNSKNSNEQKYSQVIDEKENLEKENNLLKEELEKLKAEREELLKEQERLKNVEKDYNEFTTKIYSLVDEEKKKEI